MAKRLEDGRWVVTPREAEVLEALCAGMDNKAIAVKLGISKETVSTHVSRLLAMSLTGSRLQLVVMAWERGGVVYHRDGRVRYIRLGAKEKALVATDHRLRRDEKVNAELRYMVNY